MLLLMNYNLIVLRNIVTDDDESAARLCITVHRVINYARAASVDSESCSFLCNTGHTVTDSMFLELYTGFS